MSAAALTAAICVGCYQRKALRLEVKSPATEVDCIATADRVFAESGFERVRTVPGPDMFYTPRTTASGYVSLRWGIGAWLNRDGSDSCDLALEALSEDPSAPPRVVRTPDLREQYDSTNAIYSSQPGEHYDETVRDIAKRLDLALSSRP